jgi:hypothetical protein
LVLLLTFALALNRNTKKWEKTLPAMSDTQKMVGSLIFMRGPLIEFWKPSMMLSVVSDAWKKYGAEVHVILVDMLRSGRYGE